MRAVRALISFLHVVMIRVTGMVCALSAYAVYGAVTTWDPLPGEALILMAPLIVCACVCLSPSMARALRAPRTIPDLVPSCFVATVIPLAFLLYNTPDARLLPTLDQIGRLEAAVLCVPLLLTGVLQVVLPQPAATAPQILKRHWIDGVPWRVYLISDFIAMRLFGLGLLAVGAVLYQLIQTGRPELATAISFGQPVQLALYGYGALGLLMTLPIFLPAALTVPKTPGEGVIKAAFTLFIAVVLTNAIATLWPDVVIAAAPVALPELVTSLPPQTLFTTVQAMAVASSLLAVLIPLARRSAGLRYDAEGRPLITLSGEELRRLRQARTALN